MAILANRATSVLLAEVPACLFAPSRNWMVRFSRFLDSLLVRGFSGRERPWPVSGPAFDWIPLRIRPGAAISPSRQFFEHWILSGKFRRVLGFFIVEGLCSVRAAPKIPERSCLFSSFLVVEGKIARAKEGKCLKVFIVSFFAINIFPIFSLHLIGGVLKLAAGRPVFTKRQFYTLRFCPIFGFLYV
jgi:hypothetical protein